MTKQREVIQFEFLRRKDGRVHGTEHFFNAGPQPTLLLGGAGSGKTTIGCLKIAMLADQYPGSRWAIVRKASNALMQTTAVTFYKLIPPGFVVRRNDNAKFCVLKNGSEIVFKHLDQPDSIDSLKSLELNGAYVDQAEEISAEAWDTLDERIGRWTGASKLGGWPPDWPHRTQAGAPIPPRYLFATAYSPGYDHWLTARFWQHGSERDRYAKLGYQVFTASTRDNVHLTADYVQSRLARGGEYVRRYVDAVEWGANEGAIFTIDDQSIIEPTPQLIREIHSPLMKLHRVYDHGDSSPAACVWFATDAYGNIFAFREYMEVCATLSEHRRNIYELSKPDAEASDVPPHYYSQLADPVIFNKTLGRTGTKRPDLSVADEWADKRIMEPETAVFWAKPLTNREDVTILRLKEYLRVDPKHRNPITGQLGAPRIYCLRKTPDYPRGIHELLVDIRSAKRLEIPGSTKPDGSKMYSEDRDPNVRDHLLDCARYLCASRPAVGSVPEMPPAPAGTIRLSDYREACETIRLRRRRESRSRPTGSYGC